VPTGQFLQPGLQGVAQFLDCRHVAPSVGLAPRLRSRTCTFEVELDDRQLTP